jgi:hypothetical protein
MHTALAGSGGEGDRNEDGTLGGADLWSFRRRSRAYEARLAIPRAYDTELPEVHESKGAQKVIQGGYPTIPNLSIEQESCGYVGGRKGNLAATTY